MYDIYLRNYYYLKAFGFINKDDLDSKKKKYLFYFNAIFTDIIQMDLTHLLSNYTAQFIIY